MFKSKTVASVFSKFTKDLEAVSTAQKVIARDAVREQNELRSQIRDQVELERVAEIEIVQASTAIKNIGELLGIEPKAE